jgi:hypothetical protein
VTPRRALYLLGLAAGVLLLHLALVRAMAHGHVAHVLLGSGNAAPPLGAALLAIALVITRCAAIVLAPGVVLAALASLVARACLGPPAAHSTGTTSGAGTSEALGAGASIEGRGTK